jgi:hypothetical protein
MGSTIEDVHGVLVYVEFLMAFSKGVWLCSGTFVVPYY